MSHLSTSNKARSSVLILSLLITAIQCLAVDPPPAEILHGSKELQQQYIKQTAAKSEGLRSKVARQRFEEKQQNKAAFATGLSRELDNQRQIMSPSAETTDSPFELFTVGAEPGSNHALIAGLMLLGIGITYHFRDKLFSRFEETD